jgi:hypothetical protein
MRIYNTPFEVTSTQEFISNMIQVNIKNPGFFSDELKVFQFKILTRIITEKNIKNREFDIPIDQWTPDYWNDCKEDV